MVVLVADRRRLRNGVCSATARAGAAGPGSISNGPADLALDGANAPAAALLTVLARPASDVLLPTGIPTLAVLIAGLTVLASGVAVGCVALIRSSGRAG